MSDVTAAPGNALADELPALTGLRGVAAICVLLYHAWAFAGGPELSVPGIPYLNGRAPLSFGWAGVDVFFCLSAFLLVLPFARWRYGDAQKPKTNRYLLRRILRIYPAYLFQLAILLVAALFGFGHMPNAEGLVAHLFLWFNMGWQWVSPMVGAWYTLPIEFSFYLLLPFLAPLIDRRRWPWLLVGAIAMTVAYRYAMHVAFADQPVEIQDIAIERLPGRLDQFVIGMLAGAAYVAAKLQGWKPRSPGLWFWSGVAGLVATCFALLRVADEYWSGHPLLYVWHALFSACLVPVLLACAWDARPSRMLLANRPLRYFGDISFGVYLWHMPIVLAMVSWFPQAWSPAARFWALLASVLPLTVLIAHLSHRFIELPFLRRKPAHRS